ncbi:hypothetical protein QL285_023268 [Trifolium repens]|jgi:hypothetical protein|nr:hypothetical protein QL285_023268 [Trifolium repens]
MKSGFENSITSFLHKLHIHSSSSSDSSAAGSSIFVSSSSNSSAVGSSSVFVSYSIFSSSSSSATTYNHIPTKKSLLKNLGGKINRKDLFGPMHQTHGCSFTILRPNKSIQRDL